jgi:hypothetical protein
MNSPVYGQAFHLRMETLYGAFGGNGVPFWDISRDYSRETIGTYRLSVLISENDMAGPILSDSGPVSKSAAGEPSPMPYIRMVD